MAITESVEFFNLDRVVEYALLLKNATTVARVGFFLEQHRTRSWLTSPTWQGSVATVRGGRTTSTARDVAGDWSRTGTWLCRRMSWSDPGRRSHEEFSAEVA